MPATPSRRRKAPVRRATTPAVRTPDADAPTGVRRDLLAAEVLDKAAELFARQGFAATSLKDVADAVGLQRSSIYYYYPSKDALLAELIQGVTTPVAEILQEAKAKKMPPLAEIRDVVRHLVLWIADPKTHFRLMDRSEAELPDAIAATHRDAKRRVLQQIVGLIDRAVLAGEARATNARVAALSIIGMTMWTAWWVPAEDGRMAEEVADTIADNAVALLRRAAPATQPVTVSELTDEIRDSLALIDRLTAADRRR